MSGITLNYLTDNARSRVPRIIAQLEGLELNEVAFTKEADRTAYKAKFPQGLFPTLEKGDWKLTESVAIAYYLASINNKSGLLGSSSEDTAAVLSWASFANGTFLPTVADWFRPLAGLSQYNKAGVDAAKAKAQSHAALLNSYLSDKTFFVGERLTIADLFVATLYLRGAEVVFDKEFRSQYPNLLRHALTVAHQPAVESFYPNGEPSLIEKAITYQPPKKEPAAPKAPKEAAKPKEAAAPKPKAAKDDDEEDDTPKETKAKHPCEALGAAKSFPLDEWKRQYSNNDTPDAVKWLSDNLDPQEYSFWKLSYKYPSELTQVFMSSNLITGFHTRLEGSRKYLFGSAGVYGTSNNSEIAGAYMIRGSDHKAVFEVAPDWESYEYEPLDFVKDREFIEGCWSWTNEYKGLKYADGKVFK